jgi:hypothetical protein
MSCSVAQGIFFMASTAASRSCAKPLFTGLTVGPSLNRADSRSPASLRKGYGEGYGDSMRISGAGQERAASFFLFTDGCPLAPPLPTLPVWRQSAPNGRS